MSTYLKIADISKKFFIAALSYGNPGLDMEGEKWYT